MSRGDALYQSYKNYPKVYIKLGRGDNRVVTGISFGHATAIFWDQILQKKSRTVII